MKRPSQLGGYRLGRRRNQNLWLALLAVCASLGTLSVSPGLTWAQTGTAVLTGLVQDAADRKPLEGVVVVTTSPVLQGEQIGVTDATGVYRIPNLPPGVYAIRFDRDGYFSNDRGGFELRAGITVRINSLLASRDQGVESIKLTEKAPTVDVGSSSTSANLNTEFVRRVPVSAPGSKGSASRSFESVAAAAPNASADSFGTSISGTTSPENRYIIDGLSVNNPGYGVVGTALTSEFVKEVNVVTGGYLPEYGRTTGGVLNVITKQGSNELHGSVWSFVSPGSLEGKRKLESAPTTTVGYAPKLSFIADMGADIGGAIIKDKLWFYVGVDVAQTRYNIKRSVYLTGMDGNIIPSAIPGSTQSYQANLQTLQAMAKLTWQMNEDNRFTLSAYGTPTRSGGAGQFAILPSSGATEVGTNTTTPGRYETMATRRTSRPLDASLKWTSEFLDKRLSVDTMVGIHNQKDGTRASDDSGPGAASGLGSLPGVRFARGNAEQMIPPHQIHEFEPGLTAACTAPGVSCPVGSYYTGGPDKGVSSRLSSEVYNRYQGGVVLTYFFAGLGHHLVKAGFDAEMMTFGNLKSFWLISESVDGKYFEDDFHLGILTGPDQARFLNPVKVDTKSLTAGGFIQDSWNVADKFIVNLGVRYDAQYLYSGGKLAIALPNQWSPRFGVIYDPTQAGRSRVFASYARYFENAPLALADVALAGEPHAKVRRDATICPDPGNPDPAQQAICNSAAARLNYVGDDEYYNPNRQFRAIGQGGAPVDPEVKAPSSDEIVAGAEYELFPDARAGLTYTRRWVNRWLEDLSRDNMNTFFIANPGFGSAADFPKAKRNYNAVTAYLSKVFSNNYLAQGSYTWASLKGNMTGFFRPESGDLLPNFSSDWDTKRIMETRDGPLAGDIRHSFKVFAAKDWAINNMNHVGTGVSLRAQSGGPTNFLADDLFHAPRESYIIPRGLGKRLPWQFGADIQLAYRVAFSKAMSLSVTMDVFNVLNIQRVIGTDETYTEGTVLQNKNGKASDLLGPDVVDANGKIKPGATTAALDDKQMPARANVNEHFGQPTAYQEPRIFRFGLRGEF